jgi:hypothetical protein
LDIKQFLAKIVPVELGINKSEHKKLFFFIMQIHVRAEAENKSTLGKTLSPSACIGF